MTFQEIINNEQPVLVDFSAEWCEPCKMLAPILQEVKGEMGNKLSIIKVDVDRNPNAAEAYQIRGLPTMLLFKQGKLLWRQSGVMPKADLVKVINSHI